MPVHEYRKVFFDIPENDQEINGFFQNTERHILSVQKCGQCGLMRWDPGTGCPWCGSQSYTWEKVSGEGAIYSYQIVRHAILPGFRELAPYTVVLVELDEQRGKPTEHEALRMAGILVNADGKPAPPESVAIGKRVEVTFLDASQDFVVPAFKLTAEATSGRVWRHTDGKKL